MEVTIQCVGRRRIKIRKIENIELEVVIGEDEKHLATLVLDPLNAAQLRDTLMQLTEEPIE